MPEEDTGGTSLGSSGSSGSSQSGSGGSGAGTGSDDTSGSRCGNGIVDDDEECDDGEESASCNADCTRAECGDGIVNMAAQEECDGRGESASCNADCTTRACGDGIVNMAAQEECDDAGPSLVCDEDCTFVDCGDQTVNEVADEECDGTELNDATCVSEGFDGGTLACDDACTFDTTACYDCGDGAVDPGEQCDGAELNGATCRSEGFDGGTLACDDTCAFDTAACYGCGDGGIDPGEECDGIELGGQTCQTLDFDGGDLSCTPTCSLDTAACYVCGDGAIDPGEECDGAELGGQTCQALGFDAGVLGCSGTCNFDTAGCFWESCEEVLIADPLAPSGLYQLDLDGAGPLPPFQTFCDMTTDGGGWTELTLDLGCVLGAQLVAVDSAAIEGIDAQCRPFTQDGADDHTYHYTIPFPAGFSEFTLVNYTARANAAAGDVSEISSGNFIQSSWDLATGNCYGDISFGAGEDPGPIASFAGAGANVSCLDCDVIYPDNGTIYMLAIERQEFRIGWGEACGELEGWYPWWSGTIRVR